MPRKWSRLLRTTTKNEDQSMDQNDGLKRGKNFQRRIKTTLSMDSGEILPTLSEIFLRDQTSHIGTTIQTMEDHLINAKISPSKETIEIDLEMHLSTIRTEVVVTMGTFLVLHRLQGETSHKINHTAKQGVIHLTTLPFADLTTDLRLVLHLTNKSSHKAKIRHHLMSFASPQPTMPIMNHQIFAK